VSLTGKRGFFAGDVPFLLGRYPDRPAPTHVLNALLVSAVGAGPRSDLLRLLLRGDTVPEEVLCWLSQIRDDRHAVEGFRRAMRVVFDADGKVFPSVGSPFPLHPGVVSKDPSDDGLGNAAWRLISSHMNDARVALGNLWSDDTCKDALSELAALVGGDDQLSSTLVELPDEQPPFKGTTGADFGLALTQLSTRPLIAPQHVTRSLRIAATMRGVFAAVYLATIRAPEFRRRTVNDWADTAPMFVYGGVPPGHSRSPEVRLAARSFERVVRAHRTGLEEILRARVARRRINVPRSQYARVLLASGFDLDDRTRREAEALLGQSTTAAVVASRIVNAVYPAGHLERGFRSMGSKIGFAGPDRGGGSPRFVLETPVLAALVDVTLGETRATRFEDWVDLLYESFGIIVGRGRAYDFEALLYPLESPGIVARALDANHDAVRRRMIRAGLAIEYSDTETEVRRPGG
jgi:hypothetical protein